MQNNVTELTQRLLRALDTNYNVIDMPTVIEIVSLLEKVTITKELLETTRLGKHVNELRRKTDNDSLSKRAKDLVKKWRNIFLPEPNGQLKSSSQQQQQQQDNVIEIEKIRKRQAKEPPDCSPTSAVINPKRPKINGQTSEFDFSDNSNSSFKDVINSNVKHQKPHHLSRGAGGGGGGGGGNSNHSDLILINSDSNSSIPDLKSSSSTLMGGSSTQQQQEPQLEQQLPKKRGRKKGSKNHKNLLDEAETSFSNKLAVSRGNSKVKTTQELIASLQNKNSTPATTGGGSSGSGGNSGGGGTTGSKTKEDLNIRAAKLTERVSIIDQKLNTNSNRYRKNAINKINLSTTSSNSTNINNNNNDNRIIESGSVINDKNLLLSSSTTGANVNTDDEIIVVDDVDLNEEQSTSSSPLMSNQHIRDRLLETDEITADDASREDDETLTTAGGEGLKSSLLLTNEFIDDSNKIRSLSVEEALAQLPPIDRSAVLDQDFYEPPCICVLQEVIERKNDETIIKNDSSDDDEEDIAVPLPPQKQYEFIESNDCPAKEQFDELSEKHAITPHDLHTKFLENINGNFGLISDKKVTQMTDDGLYVNVVPNVNTETIPKDFSGENYKKYSISEESTNVGSANNIITKITNEDVDEKVANDNDRTGPDNIIKNDNSNIDSERIFREWHEVVDTPSYNGEVLKILPYVIID